MPLTGYKCLSHPHTAWDPEAVMSHPLPVPQYHPQVVTPHSIHARHMLRNTESGAEVYMKKVPIGMQWGWSLRDKNDIIKRPSVTSDRGQLVAFIGLPGQP